MIDVDISNIWGQLELSDLLAMEKDVADAYAALLGGEETAPPQWLTLPEPETERILAAARKIREDSQVCLVVGTGGSCLASQAAIALLQGPSRNLGKERPQIFFTGSSLSTRHWNELTGLLQDRDFSIIAVSKSGMDPEPAIALRALRWMLERKYGTDEARGRIYAVTDPQEGALLQMAREEGWERFEIPSEISEGYAALTAAVLLPMAVAGIDIAEVMDGAAEARAFCGEASLENPVWQYAAVRSLMHRKGKAIELLVGFEPGFRALGAWWQQLFAASEGKEGKGLFPAAAEFPADLHTLGQWIQDGPGSLFETMVRFAGPEGKVTIGGDWKNLDGLNCLEGKPLDFVEEKAYLGAVEAHVDGGVPVIAMECGELTPGKVGELFCFFQLAGSLSARVLGVDPFRQPGMEDYRHNMRALLGID